MKSTSTVPKPGRVVSGHRRVCGISRGDSEQSRVVSDPTLSLQNRRRGADTNGMPDDARTSYRVVYPPTARPSLFLDSQPVTASPVVECAEGGLSFDAQGESTPLGLGAQVRGRVEFEMSHRGEAPVAGASIEPRPTVPVSGEVVRVDGRLVVLRLNPPGIPFRLLMREQLALRAHFPGWPDQPAGETRLAYRALKLER
ncbi:MAG: hypothetical protein M3R65_00365 [Gemmatimonadota bacterium]|nr:hypothetical protein [Gemmatimonadota bacterium]